MVSAVMFSCLRRSRIYVPRLRGRGGCIKIPTLFSGT